MNILVCGGRDFIDTQFVYYALNLLHAEQPVRHLIHGAARGADSLAAQWARDARVPYVSAHPADWNRYGKAAGTIRNAQMLSRLLLETPYMVVAFPGGRGTSDMVRRTREAQKVCPTLLLHTPGWTP